MNSQTRSQVRFLKALSGMTSKDNFHLDSGVKISGCENISGEEDETTPLLVQSSLDAKVDILNLRQVLLSTIETHHRQAALLRTVIRNQRKLIKFGIGNREYARNINRKVNALACEHNQGTVYRIREISKDAVDDDPETFEDIEDDL